MAKITKYQVTATCMVDGEVVSEGAIIDEGDNIYKALKGTARLTKVIVNAKKTPAKQTASKSPDAKTATAKAPDATNNVSDGGNAGTNAPDAKAGESNSDLLGNDGGVNAVATSDSDALQDGNPPETGDKGNNNSEG